MDSRIEEILKEKVGDEYEEVPLMSRIEILLDRLGSGSGDSSEYAHSLAMSIDSQTYVLTATLKNTSGETLGTPQTIDLPLETMVVNGAYDNTTKKVILTLKNGNTVDFSVADLVSGLQTEITSTNKLNSDLINDTNQNNKFVTSAEKTKIANALTEEVYNAGKQITTDNKTGEVFNDYSLNIASGNYSHAEGTATTASGNYSHAEGTATTASGTYTHAEGAYTTASGNYSHAEGNNTSARGHFSHAEGIYTFAASNNQHVQGKYNVGDSSEKYAFIIGNGTSTTSRSNAFAVDWNGLIYVNNASTGVNVSQLQPIINSSNKISADFIDDSGSPNKFVTSAEKTKLAGIETGANKTTVDSALDSTSVNPVRNSAIYTALSNKVDKVTDKQLSTEDFTTAEKTKLAGLQNYNDASCIKNIFGTSIANGDDLNTYTTAGTYACTSGAVASSLINCPYTGSGFRLDVIQTSSVNFLKQIVQPNQTDTDSSIYHRTYAVSTDTWSAWYRLTSEAVSV